MAKQLRLAAHAKINLCLKVLGRRSDGYHELDTVFQRLALHDDLILLPAAGNVTLTCDDSDLPSDRRNIVVRAAELLRRAYGTDQGVHIQLKKRIPVAAGLGGGSADAAAVLGALPAFWNLPPLPAERMLSLARSLGADVPFFLSGAATARGGGIGDVLEKLPAFAGYEVLLVKPAAKLSTVKVYDRLQSMEVLDFPMNPVLDALECRDLRALGVAAGNSLERPAIDLVPAIADIKQALAAAGASFVLMSGSGPTVFAIQEEKGWADRTAAGMAQTGWTVISTATTE